MGNEAIDYINRDIVNVKNELHTLNKIVRDGNGQPSLIQQVTNLSNRVESVEINLQSEMQELREAVESFHEYTTERSSVSWQFKAAIFVALITSLSSIFINWQNNQSYTSDEIKSRQQQVEINEKLDKLLSQKK